MLKGDLVYLEAVERSDLQLLMNWRNKEEFRKHFREYREIQNKWYETKVQNDPSTIMFTIKSAESDIVLGCCGLCYVNWVNRNADLSIYIGWEDAYIDDKGYAEESCKLLMGYGFNQLGLHKIWTEIYEFDSKKRKLYDTLGFKLDGVLRDNYFYDGKWWNSLMLSILKENN